METSIFSYNQLRKLLQSGSSICNFIFMLFDLWNDLNLLWLIQEIVFSKSLESDSLGLNKSFLLFSESLELLVDILHNLLVGVDVQHLLEESEAIVDGHELLLEVSDLLSTHGDVDWDGAIVKSGLDTLYLGSEVLSVVKELLHDLVVFTEFLGNVDKRMNFCFFAASFLELFVVLSFGLVIILDIVKLSLKLINFIEISLDLVGLRSIISLIHWESFKWNSCKLHLLQSISEKLKLLWNRLDV